MSQVAHSKVTTAAACATAIGGVALGCYGGTELEQGRVLRNYKGEAGGIHAATLDKRMFVSTAGAVLRGVRRGHRRIRAGSPFEGNRARGSGAAGGGPAPAMRARHRSGVAVGCRRGRAGERLRRASSRRCPAPV